MTRSDDMKIEQVLDEYRQGDADKRMSLFLYYRALRAAFTRIEQNDESGGQGFTCRYARSSHLNVGHDLRTSSVLARRSGVPEKTDF